MAKPPGTGPSSGIHPRAPGCSPRTPPPSAGAPLDGGRPSVSALSAALASGEPAVSMVAPVRGVSGQIAGLIAGDIVLSETDLAELIQHAAVGGTGYAQIVDGQGTVLASTLPGQLLEKRDHEGQIDKLIEEKRAS